MGCSSPFSSLWFRTVPTPLSNASVCNTSHRVKSGFLKTGDVHSNSFSFLKASSHLAFQHTLLGADFLIKSVNGAVTLA